MSYTLSIPFTIPMGMPKPVITLNLKYLLTTIHSFYRSGNTEKTIVWTNSKFVKASVERYVHNSGFPIVAEFEEFSEITQRVIGGRLANSNRVTNRLTQFMGVHERMEGTPFLHSETDIVFLDRVTNRKDIDLQFWGKTWQRPANINEMSSDTHILFETLGLEVPKGDCQWANTGLYFSNTDLSKYSREISSTLLTTDIASIVTNKPAEELFQNLLLWMGDVNANIDYEADMNLVPSRINHKPTSVQLESLHYTHGNRPHTLPLSPSEVNDEVTITQNDILALWHFFSAEMDEKYMGSYFQSVHSTEDLKKIVEKFL